MLPGRTQRPLGTHRVHPLCCLTSVVVIIVALGGACRRDEMYDGRPISYWAAALTADEDTARRRQAASAFARIVQRSPEAVHALFQAIAPSESPEVEVALADAMASLGPSARGAVPDLVRLLRDPHAFVREGAAVALGSIGVASDTVVRALERRLADTSAHVRAAAAGGCCGRARPPRPRRGHRRSGTRGARRRSG